MKLMKFQREFLASWNINEVKGYLRGRVGEEGVRTLPPPPRDYLWSSNTTGILQKKTMWFIEVEVEQETSAPPPKKNPGSAPENETAGGTLPGPYTASFQAFPVNAFR